MFVIVGANSVRIFMQNKSSKNHFWRGNADSNHKNVLASKRDIINRFVFGDHIFPYLI